MMGGIENLEYDSEYMYLGKVIKINKGNQTADTKRRTPLRLMALVGCHIC